MSELNKQLAKFKEANAEGNKEVAWSMLVKNKLEHLFLEERKSADRYGLHASAIITSDEEFCYREQILSLFYKMNQGEQLPIKQLKVFAQGNAMHEKWYKLFEATGISVAIERTLFLEKYDLNFTIDAVLNLFNEEVVCDIKSMNTFIFNKSKGHPSGEKQVMFYLWALSKYTGVPHRRGFVLCDSKNDQEIKIIPVTYSKEKILPYVDRLKNIQEMKKAFLNEKELPNRKCENSECKRASKCNMRDACWNIGKGRVKLKIREGEEGRGIIGGR